MRNPLFRATCASIVALATTSLAVAGGAERAADAFARAATKTGLKCAAKHDQRAILCIVHGTDRNVDDLAMGTVAIARANSLPLHGWTLTMVNFNDYVVSLPVYE